MADIKAPQAGPLGLAEQLARQFPPRTGEISMEPDTHLALAADIVSAYVSNNSVPPADLPSLVCRVYEALRNVTLPQMPVEGPPAEIVPAVPVKKSITDDHLVCLVTGQKFKSLKRHLAKLGMTPDDYRARFGLDPKYPMVAPAYARARSDLANQMGLGIMRKGKIAAAKAAGTAPSKRKAA